MARLRYLLISLSLALPQLVFAQDFKGLVGKATSVVNYTIPLLGGLIILAFMWGIVRYVFSNADPSEKANSKTIMVWGLIAMVVVGSIWGLVNLLKATFIQ